MKIQIKNRWSLVVKFECEIPDETPSYLQMNLAIKIAIERGANLCGASLCGANLRGANLRDANLRGADLRCADLRDANLRGADLRCADLRCADLRDANLRGADLCGADLCDANLRGADLCGADLCGDLKLVGARPFLSIGPIGSVGRTIFAYVTDKGLRIKAGCFFGDRDEFVAQIKETHGNGNHAKEYLAALHFIDAHVELWSPDEAMLKGETE